MKGVLAFTVTLLLSCVGASDEGFKFISTKAVPLPVPYYSALIFLDQGPIDWIAENEEDEIHGIVYRVAITISEIYNGLIIEKMTIGAEGFGRKIISSNRMDTYQFADSFGISGEFAGLEFVKWETFTSFQMTIHDRLFLVSNIENDTLKIAEVKEQTR